MSLFSPLLMICYDQDEARGIAGLAQSLGYPDAHIVAGGMRAAIEALSARTTSPEYIIIDIGGRGGEVLGEIDELALHCEPGVRAAVIGSVNDVTFYRQLRERGILEYFTRPAPAADIRALLMRGPSHYQPVAAGAQGTVISCLAAASGDGASTVAVNLAYCLAEELQQPTVLVDMDYQFGLVAKSLDLTAPFGIRELFDHPERGLDDMLIGKMLVKYKSLNIIASPSELRLLPVIRPEVIRELVGILRSRFRFVILDIPHVWTDWTAAALTYSDHTVMVAQLWLRSLAHASRLLAAAQGVGIPRDNISLAINRSGAKFKEAITAQDFERICHRRIDTYLANDVKAVAQAEHHGQTLFEGGQGADLQRQLRQLAKQMLALGQEEAKATDGIHRKKLRALFEKKIGG